MRKRDSSVVILSLLAAAFTAVYKAMDNVTAHNFIVSPDSATAAFAYLVIGAWTGVIFGIVFSLLFGRALIDQTFKTINLVSFVKWQAIASGGISALGTLFVLWGNQFADPSVIIALGNTTILYTALYDVLFNRARPSSLGIPVFLAVLGGILTAYNSDMNITFQSFLFVVILSSSLTAISEIIEQLGVREIDAVNFFIARFFWLAVVGTIVAMGSSFVRGYADAILSLISRSIIYVPWIVATMFFVFIGIGLKLMAKKVGMVSEVLIVLSAQTILGYLLTFAGNAIHEGVFGNIHFASYIWFLRLSGAILLISAIYLVHRSKGLTPAAADSGFAARESGRDLQSE